MTRFFYLKKNSDEVIDFFPIKFDRLHAIFLLEIYLKCCRCHTSHQCDLIVPLGILSVCLDSSTGSAVSVL